MPALPAVGADQSLPIGDAISSEPLTISAQYGQQWDGADGMRVVLLRGNCQMQQGAHRITSEKLVLWGQVPADATSATRLIAYFETNVVSSGPGEHQVQPYRLVELGTSSGFDLQLPGDSLGPDGHLLMLDGSGSDVYQRGLKKRNEVIRHASMSSPLMSQMPQATPDLMVPALPQFGSNSVPRRLTISPRYLSQDPVFSTHVNESVTPAEFVITITNGVNIVVDNVPVQMNGQLMLTRIDLTADRAVIWTDAAASGNRFSFDLNENTPCQVYLEGNIVARVGNNEARASHAFYDINNRRGELVNAEVRTYMPGVDGILRLRADSIRQLSETNFHARNAYVTTSTFGRPGYRLEAADIFVEERFNPRSLWGGPDGSQATSGTPYITALKSRFYLEEFPILALPYVSARAEEVQVPFEKMSFGYSQTFGATMQTTLNVETLFGVDLPDGVDMGVRADVMTSRGPGLGLETDYESMGYLFGLPTMNKGESNLYYVNDGGHDRLGLGRRRLDTDNNRGQVLWRNRTDFNYDTWLNTEIGYLSDRNFLEQYDEQAWDRDKDYETLMSLNHQADNMQFGVMGKVRLNDFSDQTEWLPKLDLSVLGEPVFDSIFSWSSHSSVGYGRIRTAKAPSDPDDVFQPLGYLDRASGLVGMTRHEVSAPFMLGPMNLAPYAMGEAAAWGEDYNGDSLGRLYGSLGLRGSLQFFKAMPHIQDPVFGLNGLAHKMQFDFDYYYAQATRSLDEIPQYNEFDEDAQDRFRERFVPLEFGGILPQQFDPRYYAVRSGAGRGVTDPYFELVDDQHVLRLGWRNRLQTKVGPPDRQRIKDWMVFDLETTVFPNADRDNFGETVGLISGRYVWNVGERTSLLANGMFDVFDGGQRIWNVGMLTQRSARGSLYLGFRQVEVGPIDSQLITGSYSYRMSPKWVSTMSAAYDIAEGRDRGESLTITRIGESMLLHMGFGFDVSRNNVGFGISVEPRLGPFDGSSTQMSSLLGINR